MSELFAPKCYGGTIGLFWSVCCFLAHVPAEFPARTFTFALSDSGITSTLCLGSSSDSVLSFQLSFPSLRVRR